MPDSTLKSQLPETGQLTGVDWAAWLEKNQGWKIRASYRLDRRKRAALAALLNTKPVRTWLERVVLANRVQSRKSLGGTNLGSGKVFAFPDPMTQRVLLVGAKSLSGAAQRLWQRLAGGTAQASLDLAMFSGQGVGLHFPDALGRILDTLLQAIGVSTGWIAVRSGEFLEVQTCSNCADFLPKRLSLEAHPLLQGVMHEKRSYLVPIDITDWHLPHPTPGSLPGRFWLGQPLLIGQRVIGLLGLYFSTLPSRQERERIKKLADQIAPLVESAIVFADLSQYLRRMALLNEFFVTISSSVDVEGLVRRTFALLQRMFETERVFLLILSPDGLEAERYWLAENATILTEQVPRDGALFRLVEEGIFRSSLPSAHAGYQPVYADSASALLVALQYQHHLIGMIGLESPKENNFSVYDEHILAVISGHLASLLENQRLRQEAERRVRNLELIHEVVKHTVGVTDIDQIGHITADLIARNFTYELALVIVVNSEGQARAAGIGGTAAAAVRDALTGEADWLRRGIVSEVLATGRNMLVNQVGENPVYVPLPGWEAGAEVCVALRSGDAILGAIDVQSSKIHSFTQNDLLVLEALAGILGSVVAGAGQYQNLQATVAQLEAARGELQERIAAQKMAESRLVQAAKLAAVGEMAAGIAHELNNPLTTIAGFTELALEEIPAEQPVYHDLQLVLRETKRARNVVRRLLDFARQTESVRTRSDINEIVADVLSLTNHLLRTGGITVYPDYAEHLPWVSVDRNQIKQVLLNLIHNAMHAMPAGGNLYLSTAFQRNDQRDGVTIMIRDTGVGIAPEHIPRLFEPFFTTRSHEGGTGLGLSVSYGIILNHGGRIDVQSSLGEGSTFTIWLPVEP
jgi:signal transduction histidine kinase